MIRIALRCGWLIFASMSPSSPRFRWTWRQFWRQAKRDTQTRIGNEGDDETSGGSAG